MHVIPCTISRVALHKSVFTNRCIVRGISCGVCVKPWKGNPRKMFLHKRLRSILRVLVYNKDLYMGMS